MRWTHSETDEAAGDGEAETRHHGDCGERAQGKNPDLVFGLVIHVALLDCVSRKRRTDEAVPRHTYFEKLAVCMAPDGKHRRALSMSASLAPWLRA
jgi:hypothetical protein